MRLQDHVRLEHSNFQWCASARALACTSSCSYCTCHALLLSERAGACQAGA